MLEKAPGTDGQDFDTTTYVTTKQELQQQAMAI